jgi:hypothetical protein
VRFCAGCIHPSDGLFTDWGGSSAKWLNLAGSLGFSIGAVLSLIEADRAATTGDQPARWHRLIATVAGQAALVQLASAVVLFQLSMILSATATLDWKLSDLWIWTPSALGSIGFVGANPVFLAGSIAFAIGSVLSLIELETPVPDHAVESR